MTINKDYVTANERLQQLQPKPPGLFRRLLSILREKQKNKE